MLPVKISNIKLTGTQWDSKNHANRNDQWIEEYNSEIDQKVEYYKKLIKFLKIAECLSRLVTREHGGGE